MTDTKQIYTLASRFGACLPKAIGDYAFFSRKTDVLMFLKVLGKLGGFYYMAEKGIVTVIISDSNTPLEDMPEDDFLNGLTIEFTSYKPVNLTYADDHLENIVMTVYDHGNVTVGDFLAGGLKGGVLTSAILADIKRYLVTK